MQIYKDLKNKKFGKLTAIEYVFSNKRGAVWKCICECGKEKNISRSFLTSGSTKSCGCWKIYVDKTRTRLPFGEAVFNYLFDDIKRRAKKKNILCTLSAKQFRDIITSNCRYCNALSKERKTPHSNGFFLANGVDRVDNSIGYIFSNCVSCCENCNMMKREHSVEDWIIHMKKILEHYKS